MAETIVAVSTPSGVGATAIVRLSGDDALSIVCLLTKKNEFIPRHATLTSIYNTANELIDEAIVIYFCAPHSYTREEVCEVQCHGGTISARMILEACIAQGARLAESGEFSRRAFLNGRIDFSQVNAISKLIVTKSQKAAKILVRQLKGDLGRFVEDSRESLLRLLAHSEMMIDYSEEDIPTDIFESILSQIDSLKTRLERVFEFSSMRQGMIEGYRMCIIGKPNVGKSSLLNTILLYDRAITSPIAGTTRDTIEESIQIDGHNIRLIDTAGIRQSGDEIEIKGIEKSIETIKDSDVVLAVFDASSELDNEDKEIISLLNKHVQKPCVIVLNKSDLSSKIGFEDINKMCNMTYEWIELSALEVQKSAFSIRKILGKILQDDEIDDEILLSSTYQLQAVSQAINALQKASEVFESFKLELFSYNITEAIEAISSITKPYDVSEVFDKMFTEFCLGK